MLFGMTQSGFCESRGCCRGCADLIRQHSIVLVRCQFDRDNTEDTYALSQTYPDKTQSGGENMLIRNKQKTKDAD